MKDPRLQPLIDPVYVTLPTMPKLLDYEQLLARVWESKRLTNTGELHAELERKVSEYLHPDHVALTCNGTTALLIALRLFDIPAGSEIITTPFTFPATICAIVWSGCKPVFCDIDKDTLNLNPDLLRDLITSRTKAILPVHVFGRPCTGLSRIATSHDLAVIYDAAHAFGVSQNGRPVAHMGDASILSFHATKLFSCIEGGAVVTHSELLRRKAVQLRNFGFRSEDTMSFPGINGKMSEVHAAYGLLSLGMLADEIAARHWHSAAYHTGLHGIPGITIMQPQSTDVQMQNYSYMPILVNGDQYGVSRDALHKRLQMLNVFTRKYFQVSPEFLRFYESYDSADLPVAHAVSDCILCLPMYGALKDRTVLSICEMISAIHDEAVCSV